MSLTLSTYLSHDLFGQPPNWANDPSRGLAHPNEVLRFMGGMGYPWDTQDQTKHEFGHEYLLADRQEISEMRTFFDGKFGMWGHFWVPTWTADLAVTAAIGAADASLTIEDIGYATYWLPNTVTGRYIVIVFPDGTQVCRKILAAPLSTTVTLDAAVGKACAAADLESLLVSFLLFVRFNIDEISIEHLSASMATVRLFFREVPEEL